MWIAIDGPGGTGKTTAATLLSNRLIAAGYTVHRTQQPSRSEFGRTVRSALTELGEYPYALACVITADRYQQVYTEILPALRSGATVISDRYAASGAIDITRGVPADVVWRLHDALPMPDLAVILTVGHHVADTRIQARGPHSQSQGQLGTAQREADAYRAAAQHLQAVGWPVVTIDTRTRTAVDVAETIAERVWWRSTAEATP